MPLETGDHISDLVETNPPGTDNVSQGDDHIRLIKHVLKTTFPNIDGPVTSTDEELSNLGGGMPVVTTYQSAVSAQTHTFGVGKNWYRVYVTGGGGGGYDVTGGGSGTAGGTAIKVAAITSVDATYTVGAGGALGADGGASSFDDGTETVTGGAGKGGGSDNDAASPGGIGTGGDINIQGGGASSRGGDGAGGASYWGGGNATNQDPPGSGAFGTGGRNRQQDVADRYAKPGIAGVVIIEEY